MTLSQKTANLYKPDSRFDLLTWPVIGRLLRWRWGRLVFQLFLLLIAILVVYDGFTGRQLAPQNLATVSIWLEYRGIIVLVLLLAGNFFCMSCPFTLTRTLGRKLAGNGRKWPRALRTKWVAITILVIYFFLYEWLDLWASPALTAWIVIGYFLLSFVLELLFESSPFCKYVCPLGSFNFASATISPTQIKVRDRDVCRTCVNKECINGNGDVLGCGTQLFAPQIKSNLDCVFCLDCTRACPHENIGLFARSPLEELKRDSWKKRWDVSFFILVFAATALSNAFGMVPPVFAAEEWLGRLFGFTTDGSITVWEEGALLLLIFGTLNILLPIGVGLGVSWLSRALAAGRAKSEPLRVVLARYVPAFVPLSFAIWVSHYGFHFATGALSIIPVTQFFFADIGLPIFGEPNWMLGPIMPLNWLLPLEIAVTVLGLGVSLYLVGERSKLGNNGRSASVWVQLPWILLLVLLAYTAVTLFGMPMEMRGTSLMGS